MKIINGKSWFKACPPLEGAGGGIGKFSIFILITIILYSCQNQEKEKETPSEKTEKTTDNNEVPSEFKASKIKDHPELFNDICSVSPMEFTDLYKSVKSISDDTHESLQLVQSLKKQGFEVKDWGRGNFDQGPRIISFTMQKDSCKIRVDKLYYSTDTVGLFE